MIISIVINWEYDFKIWGGFGPFLGVVNVFNKLLLRFEKIWKIPVQKAYFMWGTLRNWCRRGGSARHFPDSAKILPPKTPEIGTFQSMPIYRHFLICTIPWLKLIIKIMKMIIFINNWANFINCKFLDSFQYFRHFPIFLALSPIVPEIFTGGTFQYFGTSPPTTPVPRCSSHRRTGS